MRHMLAMRQCLWGAAIAVIGFSQAAVAQSGPDSENGRYTMSQTPDGVIRLDTRTGAVSTCTDSNGWVCRLVPDERAALDTEIGRLQKENEALKSQLADRGGTVSGKTDEPLAKGDRRRDLEGDLGAPDIAGKKSAQAGKGTESKDNSSKDTVIELRLPAQQELVAAMDRMWQYLVDLASQMQKKLYNKA